MIAAHPLLRRLRGGDHQIPGRSCRCAADPERGGAARGGRGSLHGGFHAAQALIFERAGKFAKTHRGVQAEFARHVRNDTRFHGDLRSFLGRSYRLKDIADYARVRVITQAEAEAAITDAEWFVAAVEAALREAG